MKKAFAEIIIDISHEKVDHPFTYIVPEEMADAVDVGSRVSIPFGKGNTLRTGYIIAFSEQCQYPTDRLKAIASVCKNEDTDKEQALILANWIRKQYGSTMIAALKTVLPERKMSKPVLHRTIRLLLTMDQAKEQLKQYESKHQTARARLLAALIELPEQPYSLVTGKLSIAAATIRSMESAGIIVVEEETSLRNPVNISEVGESTILLSDTQREIVEGVLRDFKNGLSTTSLIHGITGSGKTEVYISIIEEVVKSHRQAIMLIPEISLTYQTLIRFYRHFKDRVSVMNSRLTPAEKADQCERARRGEIDVMIGPRSALFTPFPNLGIIVIDEEHETSFKNENMPKYHAREVAIKMAELTNSVVVLGSATPSLEAYYQAMNGNYRLYKLTERLTGGMLPDATISDMREELREGNRSILSRALAEKLNDRLEKGEQTMLFLNRRGYSGFVSCRSCGHVMKCPHCDISLTVHTDGKMVCHYCGYEEAKVSLCPECGSKYIQGFRAGTEQIEEVLHKMYPKARVLRMDADTTKTKGSFEQILTAFAEQEADILLGTQMIVKGHDFPKVTLVGVLLADLSLYANDYRAAERTFTLLTQAAGRAGRGARKGEVVIQTYQPEHYSIQYAAAQDYEGFYEEEIAYRTLLQYPPVSHMLAVQVQSKEEDGALCLIGELRESLDGVEEVLLIGPSKAQQERRRDFYRYVIYIKSEKYDRLVYCKDVLEEKMRSLQENNARVAACLLQFDFDPMNAF